MHMILILPKESILSATMVRNDGVKVQCDMLHLLNISPASVQIFLKPFPDDTCHSHGIHFVVYILEVVLF